jgi:hypothetical protein
LVTAGEVARYESLHASAEGRAVPLPAPYAATDEDHAVLALGFGRGRQGALAVPYARMAEG